MPQLENVTLRVSDPSKQRKFYCDVLGMKDQGDGCVGYGGEEASICFLPAAGPYRPDANDLYWKIALSVPNIELAARQLRDKGLEVSGPNQFQDVGYLAKFADPEGFIIELIDHWFEGNRPDQPIDNTRLGGGAHFSLITLRTHDPDHVNAVCNSVGMTALSVQSVADYGFTLYFYAFTNEQPPVADLTSVANREWLYQRPYTALEVQHVHALEGTLTPSEADAGYVGTYLSGVGDFVDGGVLLRLRQTHS
ncbi:MAG: VOC family protein [Pseudomonadota bacterium]